MSTKLTVNHLNLKGKRALIRVDFNVPLDDQGNITDDSRISASLPTIHYVLDHGGAVILMSHLGRPKGERKKEFSLAPCAKRLGEMLGRPVKMADDCVGEEVEKTARELKPGEILLLENLRFHRAEEKPDEDPSFAEKLASLGDLYINDAFGTAHRAHSSTVSVTRFFPGRSAAGFLLEKEIKFLGENLQNPERPFYAVIGGAKVSSKIGVLKELKKKVDGLLIGGAMAYTFLKAQGAEIGDSKYEEDYLEEARQIIQAYLAAGVKLLLPRDHIVAQEVKKDGAARTVTTKEGIPRGFKGVDIGPETIEKYRDFLSDGALVFWNGPLGVFEVKPFAKGTYAIAEALGELDATVVVGGGDSVAAIRSENLAHKFTHLSTGGGASLEYIENRQLPGIEALSDAAVVNK